MNETPERWLAGPVEGVPALLQPVAHALIQAEKEIVAAITEFSKDEPVPGDKLFARPFSVASVGFHLKHIAGVLDRLCTYARKEQLSADQLSYLKQEEEATGTAAELIATLSQQVALTISQLKATNVDELTDFRGVGRKQVPSTLCGLLFHAAEHTMRHTGQLLVTMKAVRQAV